MVRFGFSFLFPPFPIPCSGIIVGSFGGIPFPQSLLTGTSLKHFRRLEITPEFYEETCPGFSGIQATDSYGGHSSPVGNRTGSLLGVEDYPTADSGI